MNAEQVLGRVRQFLLLISVSVFVMTIAELFFLSHWSETIQFLPFLLSGWGLVSLILALGAAIGWTAGYQDMTRQSS